MSRLSAALLDLKAKASALRFSGEQDALDYAAHSGEVVSRSLASQRINSLDRYVEGDVGCYISLQSRRTGHQGHLVFFRVPAQACAVGG